MKKTSTYELQQRIKRLQDKIVQQTLRIASLERQLSTTTDKQLLLMNRLIESQEYIEQLEKQLAE